MRVINKVNSQKKFFVSVLITILILINISEVLSVNQMNSSSKETTNLINQEGFVIPTIIQNPQNEDEEFFNFRLENFAPKTEDLINKTFGEELIFDQEGFWEYNSYYSHAVGFSCNLPVLSVIEYGETTNYGSTTTQSDSYYYNHIQYIKDLKPNTTYHFRIKVLGYDNELLISNDYTFTTLELSNDIILIPDDFEGQSAPYFLDKSNSKYVLTQDLVVPNGALVIKAHDIEIDLGGHTIIYDNETPEVVGNAWNEYQYNERATFGIKMGLWNYVDTKIFNGTIKQGENGGTRIYWDRI